MDKINSRIKEIIKQLFDVDQEVILTRPDAEFGDYATNVAMQLAKPLQKSPREIAETLADKLRETEEFADVSVAGPGFINIRLLDSDLGQELDRILDNPDVYGKLKIYENKEIVSEYSDPNPFKVLHVGHLYTSIIGDAISNLIENAGGNVHRVNFGGDVGLHVAKTMWGIIKYLDGENPQRLMEIEEKDRAEWMGSCYVEGNAAYASDDQKKLEIIETNKKVYLLHGNNDHESPFAHIYWTCRDWSYDYFDNFYARIGTKFERYYPESETAQIGLATVLEQKEKGVYKDSDGAVVFEGEPYGLHTRVFINSEGLPTYETKDLGVCIKKWDDYRFDQSVIITGNDITEYMKVLMKSIEQFMPELAFRTRHITHGNVKLVGAVKMSSRLGNFLRANEVIDIVSEENEKVQGNKDMSPVLGAIKYAFLKNRIGADIIFDPKESVSLQGNSGPYLQYALARARSINKKSGNDKFKRAVSGGNYTQFERSLLFKITEYPSVIEQATIELKPHYLCTYLFELAQEFNRFYENSQVVGDERESIRLNLVAAYSTVLFNGLVVLGIPTPDRM